MAKITFFGLGNMGKGMAANLIKAGHELKVFDLIPSQVAELVAQGAIDSNTPEQAVDKAEIIISMLPAGAHVTALYSDIIAHLSSNTLLIDCSTIEADTARELYKMVKAHGHRFVDAPVSGGVAGASAGTLTFIIGGDMPDVDAAKATLHDMGKHCFHAGEAGAGQVAKICNNMLLAILMSGTAEALKMAMDNGLNPKVMSQIMQQSSGNNWTLQHYNPVPNVMDNVPSSRDYEGGFMVDLMNKDLMLAMKTASLNSSIVPMGSMAQSLYQLHALHGYGQKDFSSIFQSLHKQ